jgi:hypothetical protein
MKRSLVLFLVVSFILWILPLGFFIKPSLQKLACDGQRAMCMCHIFMPKSPDHSMESSVVFKAGASTGKENTSSGGSNYFVSAKPALALNLPFASFFENQHLCYKNPYLAALEYVPKI